jgi:glycerol kinase
MSYIAAIDQGTTSTRCMLFDRGGNVISRAQREHNQRYPKPGWVEHDPLEIWENTKLVLGQALDRLGAAERAAMAGLGITNQRETSVIWDRRTGQPVCNAIVWQDTRTEEICRDLAREGGQDRFRARTGLPLATYFSGPKIKWILDNLPGARERAEAGELLFGTMDTWLIWNLTGAHVTDVTNASRTLLMDLATLAWDDEILGSLEIPRAMLPEIRSSAETYGLVEANRGLPLQETPVCGDLGDQQAALFGQTCFSPGEAKNTYGTGCFMLLNTGQAPIPSGSGLLTTLGYKIGPGPATYALEGSIAITGALVQWLRDNLGLIERSADVEALAGSVDDNGGVYFVPAFSGLFAPYWRGDARGVIAGLTRFANKGHLARAALEATAYQTCDVAEAMEKDSGVHLTALKVDGGMVSDELLMQFQADMLGVPVIRAKVSETTALGAAYAAGLSSGFWSGLDELRSHWASDREWRPQMEPAARERLCAGWKKAVTRTFDWA